VPSEEAKAMNRDAVLALLKAEQPRLRVEFGVKSLALFGSVARNEATETSDVDLLVEFGRPTGYFGLVRLQLFLQELLGCEVDLGTPDSLRPALRARVEREAIRVA
jgi:predicted nucleotidyltransferase